MGNTDHTVIPWCYCQYHPIILISRYHGGAKIAITIKQICTYLEYRNSSSCDQLPSVPGFDTLPHDHCNELAKNLII